MATYKEKVGTSVVNYAGNYPGAVDGELWYDSTNKDFKYQYTNVTAAGSWRTGGAMNTARRQFGPSSSGTQTASLVFPQDPPIDLSQRSMYLTLLKQTSIGPISSGANLSQPVDLIVTCIGRRRL